MAQRAVSVGGDRQKGLFSGTRKDACVFVSTRAGVFEREKCSNLARSARGPASPARAHCPRPCTIMPRCPYIHKHHDLYRPIRRARVLPVPCLATVYPGLLLTRHREPTSTTLVSNSLVHPILKNQPSETDHKQHKRTKDPLDQEPVRSTISRFTDLITLVLVSR